jgi:hypothetical protein
MGFASLYPSCEQSFAGWAKARLRHVHRLSARCNLGGGHASLSLPYGAVRDVCGCVFLIQFSNSGYEAAFPRRDSARAVLRSWPSKDRGRREGRVSTDPHGPRAIRKHGEGRKTRPSLRDGFNAYSALYPGPGLLAAIIALKTSARLVASVGATEPHDFTVRVSTVRPRDQVVRVAVAAIASPPHVS